MPQRSPRKPRPPLGPAQLDELALSYVGRFATTRAKLSAYLVRKVRERGWNGPQIPEIGRIVERFAESGLVDDSAFAMARAQSLGRRGYGPARVRQQLRSAGIEEADGACALDHAEREAVTSALRFAERRRLGPFAAEAPNPRQHQRQVAAMVRAGHPLGLALKILARGPGEQLDLDDLGDRFSHTTE